MATSDPSDLPLAFAQPFKSRKSLMFVAEAPSMLKMFQSGTYHHGGKAKRF